MMDDSPRLRGLANTEARHERAHEYWERAFAQQASLLRDALGDAVLGIEHVGSTAVPGLNAKPILDVIVTVEKLECVGVLEPALATVGWLRRPVGDTTGRYFVVNGPPEWRTGHLSVIAANSIEWDEQVRFWDIPLASPVVARYTMLERGLASLYPNDRRAYRLGKADFIQTVLSHREED